MPSPIDTIEVQPGVFVPIEPDNLMHAAARVRSYLSEVKDGIEMFRSFKDGLAGELDDLFPRRHRTTPKAPRIPSAERVE